MTAVVLDVNLSLDGFVAAPGSTPGQPLGQGGDPHPPTPVFVITHAPPDEPPHDSVYAFVPGGIGAALEQARSAAGDRDVRVMGGAAIGQQFLADGLVDEIVVHLVPLLLTTGTRMFENLGPEHVDLEVLEVVTTPAVTHLRYRVAPSAATDRR